MHNTHSKGSFIYGLVAALLGVALASAQSPLTKLSPEVREYVKLDDAVIALSHVRVIDGTGQPPRADQTLIIRDGKIAAIGDATSTPIPPGAKVLTLTDDSVMPGLVGMHDHMYYPQPVNLAGQRVRGVLQFEQQSSFTFPRLIWRPVSPASAPLPAWSHMRT
ncbi:MAG TPA: hypothetical protein VE957_15565 [Terriglobales bacterium]|nr:hypothetical protein [Terriglobales bacterium]